MRYYSYARLSHRANISEVNYASIRLLEIVHGHPAIADSYFLTVISKITTASDQITDAVIYGRDRTPVLEADKERLEAFDELMNLTKAGLKSKTNKAGSAKIMDVLNRVKTMKGFGWAKKTSLISAGLTDLSGDDYNALLAEAGMAHIKASVQRLEEANRDFIRTLNDYTSQARKPGDNASKYRKEAYRLINEELLPCIYVHVLAGDAGYAALAEEIEKSLRRINAGVKTRAALIKRRKEDAGENTSPEVPDTDLESVGTDSESLNGVLGSESSDMEAQEPGSRLENSDVSGQSSDLGVRGLVSESRNSDVPTEYCLNTGRRPSGDCFQL